jgi:hypothetical protein
MTSGLPSGPLIWTVVAVGLINALAAYGIAHLVAPNRAPVIATPVLVIVAIAAVIALVLCVRGWRAHYRRRRMVS